LGADSPKTASLPQSQLTPLDPVRIGFVGIERIENLYLLHCVSQYPTEDSNVNLRALRTMKDEFSEYKVGYSDHSRGIEACLAAVALGAEVIEKHFTFHTRLPADDHAGAMTPETLHQLVEGIQRLEVMLGSSGKAPMFGEQGALSALRVKLHEVDFE